VATYFTDFSEYGTGSLPADWTEQAGSGATTVVSDGSNVLKIDTASSTSYVVSWDDVDGDSDRAAAEVLVKVKVGATSNATGDPLVSVCVRGSGSNTFYWFGLRTSTAVRLSKLVSGTLTTIASATVTSVSTG